MALLFALGLSDDILPRYRHRTIQGDDRGRSGPHQHVVVGRRSRATLSLAAV